MLKTVLDHQKATVISEELPISFSGVSLLRRSGVCLCGISTITAEGINEKDKQVAALQKHLEKTPNTISFNEAIQGILQLRELHVQMDEAVLDAYGWNDIALRHDFYEVDYLPENDRIRFTIQPDARKEVLKRLLELNHKIHEEEVKAGLWEKRKPITKDSAPEVSEPEIKYDLFNQDTL